MGSAKLLEYTTYILGKSIMHFFGWKQPILDPKEKVSVVSDIYTHGLLIPVLFHSYIMKFQLQSTTDPKKKNKNATKLHEPS